MKKKDNISNYIKNDLENRELTPSHDAWDRIQARMDVASPTEKKTTNKWWLSVAAVTLLTVTTSVYFFVNHQNNDTFSSDYVKHPVQQIIDTAQAQNETIHDSTQHYLANNEVENSTKKVEVVEQKQEKQVVQKGKVQLAVNNETHQIEMSLPKQNNTKIEPKEEIKDDLVPKRTLVSNNSDSIKINKKKKNFVDPNMLLYSIENKENLKESNQSRVVSVGFK